MGIIWLALGIGSGARVAHLRDAGNGPTPTPSPSADDTQWRALRATLIAQRFETWDADAADALLAQLDALWQQQPAGAAATDVVDLLHYKWAPFAWQDEDSVEPRLARLEKLRVQFESLALTGTPRTDSVEQDFAILTDDIETLTRELRFGAAIAAVRAFQKRWELEPTWIERSRESMKTVRDRARDVWDVAERDVFARELAAADEGTALYLVADIRRRYDGVDSVLQAATQIAAATVETMRPTPFVPADGVGDDPRWMRIEETVDALLDDVHARAPQLPASELPTLLADSIEQLRTYIDEAPTVAGEFRTEPGARDAWLRSRMAIERWEGELAWWERAQRGGRG
jgi:hypothetical protein